MHYSPSILYRFPLADMQARLSRAVDQGCRQHPESTPIRLFFRADDIGVPSEGFNRMIGMFQASNIPLCLAVVPSWLTVSRYRRLRQVTGNDDRLWCWHQHGRLHKNFETTGKKQEFGPARNKAAVKNDLARGGERLHDIMGECLSPFFTPPWNRLSRASAEALVELGFVAVSRFHKAKPDISDIIPDIPVNVDLHTRKEPTAKESFSALLTQLEAALASGSCGIMLHHQRMNEQAFRLLDELLRIVKSHEAIEPVRFEAFMADSDLAPR